VTAVLICADRHQTEAEHAEESLTDHEALPVTVEDRAETRAINSSSLQRETLEAENQIPEKGVTKAAKTITAVQADIIRHLRTRSVAQDRKKIQTELVHLSDLNRLRLNLRMI
jgi:hypothetical protein